MTIKILPPQLANQIAAGEVVERPASVVKELVENALDAGASHIDVEIDKGGHKRILIRDNGKGVDKAQLTLALSRHATSKISDIDDLEAIASLGFRGEALASISSVARLTMTSKPAAQNEAWSAIAEGLDMGVKVMPAAHPNGTSVEVLDLFFNTPARRKFLRAEKTEFSHIETLIKRIALSRPDVGFVLKHNNKVVKRFRSQKPDLQELEQKSNRIADVISKSFIEQASVTSCVYDDIEISVWAKSPHLCVSVNPAQYSFVNGRMMRDKLIQHAIRQSYGQKLQSEQSPEYVIFIDLPATDVDVNVHPAKHEVRFHHSRLLHDLLIKTIQDALAAFEKPQAQMTYKQSGQNASAEFKVQESLATKANTEQPDWVVTANQPARLIPSVDNDTDDKQPLRPRESVGDAKTQAARAFDSGSPKGNAYPKDISNPKNIPYPKDNRPSVDAVELSAGPQYFSGLTPKNQSQSEIAFTPANRQIDHQKLNAAISGSAYDSTDAKSSVITVLFIQTDDIQQPHAYCEFDQKLWLISVNKIFENSTESQSETQTNEKQRLNSDLEPTNAEKLAMTPLLVPLRLKLSAEEKQWVQAHETLLESNGFDLKRHQQFLIIKQVPNVLRGQSDKVNANDSIPSLFGRLMQNSQSSDSLIAAILNPTSDSYTKADIQAKLNLLSNQDKLEQYMTDNAVELNVNKLLETH